MLAEDSGMHVTIVLVEDAHEEINQGLLPHLRHSPCCCHLRHSAQRPPHLLLTRRRRRGASLRGGPAVQVLSTFLPFTYLGGGPVLGCTGAKRRRWVGGDYDEVVAVVVAASIVPARQGPAASATGRRCTGL